MYFLFFIKKLKTLNTIIINKTNKKRNTYKTHTITEILKTIILWLNAHKVTFYKLIKIKLIFNKNQIRLCGRFLEGPLLTEPPCISLYFFEVSTHSQTQRLLSAMMRNYWLEIHSRNYTNVGQFLVSISMPSDSIICRSSWIGRSIFYATIINIQPAIVFYLLFRRRLFFLSGILAADISLEFN